MTRLFSSVNVQLLSLRIYLQAVFAEWREYLSCV
jgi:hypothetical protein